MLRKWSRLFALLVAAIWSGISVPLLFAEQTKFIEAVANTHSAELKLPIAFGGLTPCELALHPDANRAFFTAELENGTRRLYVTTLEGVSWSEPRRVYPKSDWDERNPSVSPDGKTLLLASRRPVVGGEKVKPDLDIWSVDLQAVDEESGKYPEPIHIDGEINSDVDDRSPSMTRRGIIYYIREFHSDALTDGVFRYSPTNRGQRRNQQIDLPDSLELGSLSISMLEDLLYFSAKVPGRDDYNLFVSLHQGTCWEQPVAFLSLNTPMDELSPQVIDTESSVIYLQRQVASDREMPVVRHFPIEQIINSIEYG